MSSRRFDGGDDPFAGNNSPAAVSDEIFGGGLAELNTGRMVAHPIPIESVWPDLRQPRRAVPLVVRGQWNGDSEFAPGVLSDWHQYAERAFSDMLNAQFMLRGMDKDNYPDDDPVATGYLELVALASSILNEGLNHPISVVKKQDRYVIESGERRWLAYHLLVMYVDAGKYARIPAVVKPAINVWSQAAENGARRPLNAIGMARQLALLIMDMYKADDGIDFGEFDDVVLPGECDRVFYAQVADGLKFQIKKGFGKRVLDVTGLKSAAQVSQYRRLLNILDQLWMDADEGDWTENFIREKVTVTPPKPAERLTPVKRWGEEPHPLTPSPLRREEEGIPTPNPLPQQQGEETHPSPLTPLPVGEGEKISTPVTSPQWEEGKTYPTPSPSPLAQGGEQTPVASEIERVQGTLDAIEFWSQMTTKNGAVNLALNHLKQMTPVDIHRAMQPPGSKQKLLDQVNAQNAVIVTFVEERWAEVQAFFQRIYDLIDMVESDGQ